MLTIIKTEEMLSSRLDGSKTLVYLRILGIHSKILIRLGRGCLYSIKMLRQAQDLSIL